MKSLQNRIPVSHWIMAANQTEKDLNSLLQRRKHGFNLTSLTERFDASTPIQDSPNWTSQGALSTTNFGLFSQYSSTSL